jgi:hypothetical protein
MPFSFSDNEKFSLIAIDNCFSEIEEEVELADGTWVLPKMPATLDDQWVRWIGELRADSLRKADLVIVRRVTSDKPEILDGEHSELFDRVQHIFSMLQLSSIVLYDDASAVQGSMEKGRVNIRQMAHLNPFYRTANEPQIPITIERLAEAVKLVNVWKEIEATGKYERFIRGSVILQTGLQRRHDPERVQHFTRAIEGLVLPEKGNTANQFKERGQTLGVRNKAADKMLYESYQMRCDAEHVHALDRTLSKEYPPDKIEEVATIRTRQMEALARLSYRRILLNADIRKHFESDASIGAFWKLTEPERGKIWGEPIDVTRFSLADEDDEKRRHLQRKYPEQWA